MRSGQALLFFGLALLLIGGGLILQERVGNSDNAPENTPSEVPDDVIPEVANPNNQGVEQNNPDPVPAGRTWSGQVVDAIGRPMAAATSLWFNHKKIAESSADSDGRFSLTAPNKGAATIAFEYRGSLHFFSAIPAGQKDLLLFLPGTDTIGGEFTNWTVGQRTVAFISPATETAPKLRIHTLVSEGGKFSLHGTDTDREYYAAIPELRYWEKLGYPSKQSALHPTLPDNLFLGRIRLTPGSEKLDPPPQVELTLDWRDLPAEVVADLPEYGSPLVAASDPSGHFEFKHLRPGTATLTLPLPGDAGYISRNVDVEIPESGEFQVDIPLTQVATLEITATDPNGKELRDIRWRVGIADRKVSRKAWVPVGTFDAWVSSPGYEMRNIEDITFSAGQTVKEAVTLRPNAPVTIRYLDGSGRPLSGVQSRIVFEGRDRIFQVRAHTSRKVDGTASDGQGEVYIDYLPAGVYQVSARLDGYAPLDRKIVLDHETSEIRLAMSPSTSPLRRRLAVLWKHDDATRGSEELRTGDLLLTFAGKQIRNEEELLVAQKKAADLEVIPLLVRRGNRELTIQLTSPEIQAELVRYLE